MPGVTPADVLSNFGITLVEDPAENQPRLLVDLPAAELVEHAIRREEGRMASNGALVIETGERTGRSPNDRFIVDTPDVHDKIAWGAVNRPLSVESYEAIKAGIVDYLNERDVFVTRGMAGADRNHTRRLLVACERASQALFIKQMLARPLAREIARTGEPDFCVLAAPGYQCDPAIKGLNSSAAVVINFQERVILVAGTGYSGEIKKSIFSVMNYLLPVEDDVLPMHCSASMDPVTHETAVFFGLSGTGKTTLSTDPKRELIGDDEHGWDDDGVFNFEGGCYAKVINLSQENEPDIWNAIRRNALLENVTVDKKGKIDYADKSVTENTRVSYPIFHIENIVKPVSKAPAAKKVIFLSADAFGVLPPVSILNSEQTKYYFLSGFTAKLAGTERGITEPTPTFSACFGAAFLSLHPTKYGEELVKKMKKAGAKAYLVNTGWNGTGKRISIKDTRGIIDAILDGSIDKAPTKTLPIFDFTIPTELPGVDPKILDPRDTYKNAKDWDVKAEDLANRFVKNFVKFTGNEEGKKLVAAGPKVK